MVLSLKTQLPNIMFGNRNRRGSRWQTALTCNLTLRGRRNKEKGGNTRPPPPPSSLVCFRHIRRVSGGENDELSPPPPPSILQGRFQHTLPKARLVAAHALGEKSLSSNSMTAPSTSFWFVRSPLCVCVSHLCFGVCTCCCCF